MINDVICTKMLFFLRYPPALPVRKEHLRKKSTINNGPDAAEKFFRKMILWFNCLIVMTFGG